MTVRESDPYMNLYGLQLDRDDTLRAFHLSCEAVLTNGLDALAAAVLEAARRVGEEGEPRTCVVFPAVAETLVVAISLARAQEETTYHLAGNVALQILTHHADGEDGRRRDHHHAGPAASHPVVGKMFRSF